MFSYLSVTPCDYLGHKNVVLGQNSDATKYEYQFFIRSLMMCANFMLRHQGSGSEAKDVQTYFRETFDQGSGEFAFQTTAQTVFLNLLGALVDNLTANPENLSKAIEALLMSTKGIADGALFSRREDGVRLDLLIKRIRTVVLGILKGDAPAELKAKCVELLMRVGIVTGSPEDLVLAA